MILGGCEESTTGPSSSFSSQASATVSAQKFKQWVEGGENADVFGSAVVVGYAAYRPGGGRDEDYVGGGGGDGEGGRVNDLDGTLEESDVFKEFTERFEREKREQEEGGKPVTELRLEVRREVQKTSLMEFVERNFRKKQRGKATKGTGRKGKGDEKDGGAGQGGQVGQAQGKGKQQKGRGGGRGEGRGKGRGEGRGEGRGGQKNRNRKGLEAGSVSSKDSSAQVGRQGQGQGQGESKSQAPASGKNPQAANDATGESKPRGTKAPRRGKKKGGKAAEGTAPNAAAKINILNPNAASFA